MSTNQRKSETRINSVDIFGGIFALVKLAGHLGIDPNRHTQDHYFAYDSACVAVAQRVLEISEERGDNCRFRMITHVIHGDSPAARDELTFWLSTHTMHLRTPGNGMYYFSIDDGFAEHMLETSIRHTGYTREIFEELAQLFLSIYNG